MTETKKTITAEKIVVKKSPIKKTKVKKSPTKKTKVKKSSIKKLNSKKNNKKLPTKPTIKSTGKLKKHILIEIDNITKHYGKVEVLNGISFNIMDGEKLAIVGANGAGKTTLTEIIAKVKEPSSGEIKYFFEEDGKQSHGKTKISANIGIQFQDSSYPDFYKVNDIVEFIIRASGIKISSKELDTLYKTFDLDQLENDVAKSLSGGQQQRLNVLLAIVNNPKLLILDEVGTGLDVESRTKIKSYIKSYTHENSAAMILVSHNSDEVTELVDRVIVIHNGLIFNDEPLVSILAKWKTFDGYMNHLYLNVFKKNLDLRANKSGRGKSK